MKIRRCEEKDIHDVYLLINDLEDCVFNEVSFQTIYNELIRKENNAYFVAEENNEVIGFLSLEMNYKLHHNGRVGIIEEFVIREDYRSKGYGKVFLHDILDYAKEQGCLCIELTSNFRRKDAHRFYENNGFDKTSYKFFKELI